MRRRGTELGLLLLLLLLLLDGATGRSTVSGKKPKARPGQGNADGGESADSDGSDGGDSGGTGMVGEKDSMVEEAASLVEAGQFKQAEYLLEDVGRLTKKSKHRALFQTLKGQIALNYEPEGKSRRSEATAAFRQAVKLAPKDAHTKLRLAKHLLSDVHGCPSGVPDGSAEDAAEAGKLLAKVLRSGEITGQGKLEARLVQVRVLRIDAGQTGGTAKDAEETLGELIKATGLSAETAKDADADARDLYSRMLLESGHLYLQHQMHESAVHMYQNAYNAAAPGTATKNEAQQGGAMGMAKQAKCDKGAKDPNCGKALKLFQAISDEFVTGDAWWMRGQIHKNVYDDIQPAMEAMVKACARVDYNAAWWDKLARWSQMLHHRLGSGGFDNFAIKQARAAMKRNHELNPYSAPAWESKVPGILEAQQSNDKRQGEFKCKNPIAQTGEGFLDEDSLKESVSFTLRRWRSAI